MRLASLTFFLVLSCKTSQLSEVKSAGQPYVAWEKIGQLGNTDQVVVCENGQMYAFNFDKAVHFKVSDSEGLWQQIGQLPATSKITCAYDRLWALNSDGSVHRNDANPGEAVTFAKIGSIPTDFVHFGVTRYSNWDWHELPDSVSLLASHSSGKISTLSLDRVYPHLRASSTFSQYRGDALPRIGANESTTFALSNEKTLFAKRSGRDRDWVAISVLSATHFVSVKNDSTLYAVNDDQSLQKGRVIWPQ